MSKIIFKLFVVLSLFSSLNSISVVNNETVSSDFLQEQFLKELQIISTRSGLIDYEDFEDQKCVFELQEIVKRLPSVQVLPFIDSWGGLPSGILYGHSTDFGNYDQCVKTTVRLMWGITTGQYCYAAFPLQLPGKSLTLKIGVCVPDSCSAEMTTKILRNALKDVLGGVFANAKVVGCSVEKKPDYEPLDIFAIVLFCFIGFFMVLSTLYDICTTHLEMQPMQLLMAFSIISNGRKLFMINTKPSKNSINCLIGIRVFSMVWVMYAHDYMFYAKMNLLNSIDILTWYKSFWAMTVLMATVSVDSFFFISGLLVVWLGLPEMEKRRGRLNVIMMYVHRYIRLTPPVAAVILFYVTLNKFIGSGPFRKVFVALNDNCKTKWWTTLLYIQNYAYPDKMCIDQSWYLAVDTQLYVLSPLFLISLWKWGKKCIPVIIGLCLLSIGCVIATYIVEGYTDLVGLTGKDQSKRIYFPTHTRCCVWLVGICVGYFMHVNRQRNLRPPMVIQIVGWILSFGTLLSIVFAPYHTMSSIHSATIGEAATYESLRRICWGIALAWIVVACHHGFGGIVNSILSHPIWQPFGRLTYCMYLVHLGVININLGTVRTDIYFSDYTLMLQFWSTFGMSLLVAIVWSLSFEAPILVIEKALIGTKQQKDDLNEPVLPSYSKESPLPARRGV